MTGRRKNQGTFGLFFTLKGYIMVKNLPKNFEDTVSIWHFFGARGQALLPGSGDMRPDGQNGPYECLSRRKDMRENTSVHRLLRRALSLCLALALTVSLCVPALAAQRRPGERRRGGRCPRRSDLLHAGVRQYLTYTAQDSSGFLIGEDDVAAEIHTQEISLDSFDENGQLRMSFPFAYKDAVYVDDETGDIYDYSAWCQIVRVRAYDAAGHVTTCNALLYDTVYGQKMYEESGFKDARYSDGTIRGDILELDPLWNQEDAKLTDTRFFITNDMLDENGNLHVRATLDRDANLVVFNDNVYAPQEGSRQVEFDIPIRQGVNLTYVKTLSSAFAENDFGTVYKLYLYYLPDTEPSSLRFDDERIADGAVVYTNEDAFTVSGDITSLYGNVGLKINGNQLLYPAGDLNVLAEPITQVFSYGAQLQEGENVVTVEFTDEATGAATTVAFTVVKDTAAPEAPVIAQGGDGKVTLTAAEEDVTLYYSYDGTEWVLYTGPFAPTATPVYAKAVDRVGNESAVSRLAVQVTASQPVQTGDAAPVAVYTALLLTAAALAAAAMLRRRRVK